MHPGSSERLIQALKRPQAYPHDVAAIELIETHISWVLLTGRYAYKIKKPVNLGFVDFSTLQRRRFFCDEELRLNRRLAPSLYLDVVAITGTPEEPSIDGTGKAIEFTVRMRQFLSSALLSRVLERNALQATHIDALAAEVADFHAKIAVAPADSPFGGPSRVYEPVAENFRQIEIGPSDSKRHDQLRRLRDWSENEHAARQIDFSARKNAGFVRECHGDMHLGNMVLEGERIVIFDGIEFNESFRWIDVVSEVAFCTMDLEDRGRAELSHRFLNAYLELTGDYAGLVVLHYYLVYRAMVRAKVAGIRLRQAGLAAGKRKHELDKCYSYLDLADWYAREPRPWLAITHGFSGSGKTTGTMRLVEALGAIRIRSDVERKRLFGYESKDSTGSGIGADLYAADASKRTYDQLAELAAVTLCAGFSVIIDATFLKTHQRGAFRELAHKLGVPFRVISFDTPEAVLQQRIASRQHYGHDASEADLSVLAHQIQTHDPLATEDLPGVISVNTQSPDSVDQLVATIQKLG